MSTPTYVWRSCPPSCTNGWLTATKCLPLEEMGLLVERLRQSYEYIIVYYYNRYYARYGYTERGCLTARPVLLQRVWLSVVVLLPRDLRIHRAGQFWLSY